ncbi:hypothetical protein CU044_3750 [Streptomyces sp. L-9-10]|uniref:hypothetical protein n=1 Tax=Streptomyces sp. L-9-10 TaxID=1478131 RepID=UPI00101C993A|nr:hypothetical protein [Streptomyces sp. L-9-10]RYJ26457.1 hypothetical protein CU044_3750 [Streptomyces sp. L-9-10]
MTDKTINEPGEQHTEDSPGLATRAVDSLRSGLTGEAATALLAGSGVLIRKGWQALPDDNPLARLGYVGLGGYIAVYAAAHAGPATPFVAPTAVLGWCIAAWTVSPEPGEEPEAEDHTDHAEEEAEEDGIELSERDVFLLWLEEVTRGRSGIHFTELHERLAKHPAWAGMKRTDVGPLLRGYGIPTERSLRVGPVAGRTGVARAAVEGLLSGAGLSPSPGVESSDSSLLETWCDLRESPGSPSGEELGEDSSSASDDQLERCL